MIHSNFRIEVWPIRALLCALGSKGLINARYIWFWSLCKWKHWNHKECDFQRIKSPIFFFFILNKEITKFGYSHWLAGCLMHFLLFFSFFSKNLEECLTAPERIAQVFIKSEKKFQMYIKYCQNKPKSEYLVSEFFEYFEVSSPATRPSNWNLFFFSRFNLGSVF